MLSTVELPTSEIYLTERQGPVLVVTLNRPDSLNAISRQVQDDLARLWPVVAKDPTIRCVIFTGAGRAFSAGADTSDLEAANRPDKKLGVDALNFCPGRNLDIPVIVAINGLCVGGGLNFLADADIAIMAEGAFLTDPHVTMGQVSGPEVLQIAAKVNFMAVSMMALCGSKFRMQADRALRAGLVAEVVPGEQLMDRALEIAQMVSAQSPTAIRKTLKVLRGRARNPIKEELPAAWDAVVSQWGHPDTVEGPKAFMEKRAAEWDTPDLETVG